MTTNKPFAFSYQALIEFMYYPNDQSTPLWLLVGQRTHAALLAWLREVERINGRDVTIDPTTCRIEDAVVVCAPPMEEGIIRGIWRTGEKDQPFGFRDLNVKGTKQ